MSKPLSSCRAAVRGALAPALLGVAALLPAATQASVFTEVGDAGQTLASVQSTAGAVGPGTLSNILGRLDSGTDADLFLINIVNPAAFSASTVNLTTGFLDTQLFLFTAAGAPVYLNDDDAGGLSVGSTLPAGNAFGPTTAGTYVLGVSLSGYDPVNVNNQLLFDPQPLSFEVRGPAANVSPATLGGFFSLGTAGSGNYSIELTGAVAAVPEPAAVWMVLTGLAGIAGVAARRRRG